MGELIIDISGWFIFLGMAVIGFMLGMLVGLKVKK